LTGSLFASNIDEQGIADEMLGRPFLTCVESTARTR